MELKEKLDQVTELVKLLKETKVAETPDQPDLMMYLHFFRGDTMPIVAECRSHFEEVMQAAWIGAKGFSASEVVLSSEAYHATVDKSPITGENWQPHEARYVAETMPEANAVLECVTSMIVDRSGRTIVNLNCYRITDGVLEWLEELLYDGLEADDHGGRLIIGLRETMAQPLLAETMSGVLGGMLPEALGSELFEYHCDVATSRILSEKNLATHVMIGADPGTTRYQLIHERMGEPDA